MLKKRTFLFSFVLLFFVIFSCSTDANNLINQDSETTEDELVEEGATGTEESNDTSENTDTTEEDGDTENAETTEEDDDSTSTDETSDCSDLVLSDEFDGTVLDETKWKYQRGGWNGSNVQNCYVDENTAVADGSLKITAKYEPGYDCFNDVKDFTSGFIQTKDRINWTYGYFEAKVKVPASNSTWPAFWLSPQEASYGAWPRSGEIDVFEIKGHDMTKSYGNAHWGNSPSDKRQEKGVFAFEDATKWHIYAVEWNEGELKFYIDNELYHTINDFRAPNATMHPGPFNIGFYLRLNMAVGGNYLSEPHNDANNKIEQLPAVMEVDYVRVYSKKPDC